MLPFVKTRDGIDVFVNGEMKSVSADHVNFDAILEAIYQKDVDVEVFNKLIDVTGAIKEFSEGALVVNGGVVEYNGFTVSPSLTSRIVDLLKEDQPVTLFVNFLENLYQNPSARAVNELYGFLDVNNIPLTPDGCFLTYKKVSFDYKDLHTGTFDNSIGKTVKMARHQVDDNKEVTCSQGLHVASYDYMPYFGGTGTGEVDNRVVICKVNPKDVVSVPVDYDNAKMRVCEYTVIGEIPNDGMTKLASKLATEKTGDELRALIAEVKAYFKKVFALERMPLSLEGVRVGEGTKVSNARYRAFLKCIEKAHGLGEVTGWAEMFEQNPSFISVSQIVRWIVSEEKVELSLV